MKSLSDAATSAVGMATDRHYSKGYKRTAAEERFRLRLKLFVTIETWFFEVQQSLYLLAMHNSDYDEYMTVHGKTGEH